MIQTIELLPMLFLLLALFAIVFGGMLMLIPPPLAGCLLVVGFGGFFLTMATLLIADLFEPR